MTDLPLWWYTARAGGVVAWVLLTAAVLAGLLLRSRLLGRLHHPAWLTDLHRHLGGLAVAFTAVHAVALLADSYVQIGPTDLVVPFASHWRPAAVAWGVVAFDLLVAVEVSSLLRRRIPRRLWLSLHLTSAPLWLFATLHAVWAGSERTNPAFRGLLAGGVLAVGFALTYRLVAPPRGAAARPAATNPS